ncbi:MAG: hypothetical protein KC493_01765 [Bacteriovoracaceae bacterium]|nr:hypothetical protein [Bacteriovoracaceae bacterium]
MKKLTLILTCLLFIPQINAQTLGSCEHIKKIAKSGDILFISLPGHAFYEKVEKAMNHWATHVGMVLKNDNDELFVSESTYPFSKDTSFCKFVDRAKGKVAVSRLRGIALNSRDLLDLRVSSKKRLGVYYHLGFKLDSSKQFCSKFVWEIYKEALGIEVGKIETFQDILDTHEDPQRREEAIKFFKFWFFHWAIPGSPSIPWERRTVSPKSQYEDSDLKTIYTWEK